MMELKIIKSLEEFNSFDFKRGQHGLNDELYEELMKFPVGQGAIITKKQYYGKTGPSGLNSARVGKPSGRKWKTATLKDGSGWAILRVA